MNTPSANSPVPLSQRGGGPKERRGIEGCPEASRDGVFASTPLGKGNIRIVLNGKQTEISAGTSLKQLLEELKLKPQMVAVELNEKIIKRGEYSTTILSECDRIEILQMIGGG